MTKSLLPDIKPYTPAETLDRSAFSRGDDLYPIGDVMPAVGMSGTFIRKVTGKRNLIDPMDVLTLLDQDCYSETFIPRSRVLEYLNSTLGKDSEPTLVPPLAGYSLIKGNALDLIRALPRSSVDCVVTSTPYWALRIYKEPTAVAWADGEQCVYGHEQTPEGFLRHTTEVLRVQTH